MARRDIREWLKIYPEEKIYISKHITEERAYRGIPAELIRKSLMDPANLIRSTPLESDNPSEFKYKLWFRVSRAKTLALIVSLNERLKVITAYEIVNKWQRKMWWK